ncbi:DNA-directed RNA polymerase IV subunit 1 isoform X2 [Magnolia sinica]|nr:DNA-directed RNA polymerase IV subunit 1 isoform X2 [Magnolia sinica]XP_058104735.1 DNA-directed RNA polymerase IV subunit 1 isoform X2 [Magnolia sinica]
MGCKYCTANSSEWYPGRKFKVASKDASGKRSLLIVAEVNDRLPKKFQSKNLNEVLPADYWDFIPKDPHQQKFFMEPNKIILSPYQVFFLLKDLDPKFIEKFVPRRELLFLTSFPVTPNCNRVTEAMHLFSDGSRLIFLRTKKSSSSTDVASSKSGLKWIREVLLGKRTDHVFRMTVVGDPKIRLGEIGIPHDISEKLVIPENINLRNLKKLNKCCNSRVIQMRDCYAKSKAGLASVHRRNELQVGDIIYRPLEDGDLVLVNRPPSVHQHSLIAFSVKILPVNSVIAINPLCCAPLLGDFDGDCLHGYIPQSINCRAELRELVSLNRQLVNGQDGRNLVSLSQDSLTAAHLITGSEVFLNRFQMQQLEMLCPRQSKCPTILKAPPLKTTLWTGKQLFSLLLPQGLDFDYASNSVLISNGDLMSSSDESAWLRNTRKNVFSNMIRHCPSQALNYLFAAQEVLCEWISGRGLSVSLSDIYLSPDSYSRMKMIDEVSCGLQEADRICRIKRLMLDDGMEHFLKHGEGDLDPPHVEGLRKQKLAVLNQAAIDAFKEVRYDLQNVIHQYAGTDNSMLAMINAGSKGNLLKLLQQSVCLGLQHSTDSLPFRIPDKLSCASCNQQKLSGLRRKAHDTIESTERHISCAVVEHSFLDGLNPLECFVHALSCRGNCFSENADLPGTLTRKLMFYMRDLYVTYDGTVRSAYGNQLIQFSYGISEDTSDRDDKSHKFFGERMLECDGLGGQPVGAWSACSIAEAAYSALDQPISMHEASPLINLKKVLECGQKETYADQTVSLFLSKKLRRWTYGSEYGALEVKSHLERIFLSDVVTTVMIVFEPDIIEAQFSSWVSHFHVCKERMRKRRLTIGSIIDALNKKYNSRGKTSTYLPRLQILSCDCSLDDVHHEHSEKICITVAAENSKDSPVLLDTVRDMLIPILLGTVIKGFLEFKKVNILWHEPPKTSKFRKDSSGELFLKVSMSEDCERGKLWNTVQDACIPIMDLIDWERSHPDHVYDISCAYGVDAAWHHFLETLRSTLSDIGRDMHREHLLILADCLSVTGEFSGLSPKGIKEQRDQISITSPFMQACFSNPSNCFIKAAKEGAMDDLLGTLDAVAWGKEAPIGTGGPFDILYSGKGKDLDKPVAIYETLCSQPTTQKDEMGLNGPGACDKICKRWGGKSTFIYDNCRSEYRTSMECKSNSDPRLFLSKAGIKDMCILLQEILHKYPVNAYVNEEERSILMKALSYHPQGNEKMAGAQEIKVGHNPLYPESRSRCFILVRKDGSFEDFSYRKCVEGAARHISPEFAAWFRNKVFKR